MLHLYNAAFTELDVGDFIGVTGELFRTRTGELTVAVRSFEFVARQGGDEFAVLLPNTGTSEALRMADRLRAELASRRLHGVALSASIGVAGASVPVS